MMEFYIDYRAELSFSGDGESRLLKALTNSFRNVLKILRHKEGCYGREMTLESMMSCSRRRMGASLRGRTSHPIPAAYFIQSSDDKSIHITYFIVRCCCLDFIDIDHSNFQICAEILQLMLCQTSKRRPDN